MTDPVNLDATAKETALGMVVLKYLTDRIRPAQETLRFHAVKLLDKKERVVAKSSLDGTQLGTITKSDPKPKATITNPARVYEWVRDHYPERLDVKTQIVGSDTEVIAVLAVHAPHLIDEVLRLPEWVTHELVLKAEQAGQPVGWGGEIDVPGIEVTIPEGSVSVRLEKEIDDAVLDLVRAGLVEIDGTVRALPEEKTTNGAETIRGDAQ